MGGTWEGMGSLGKPTIIKRLVISEVKLKLKLNIDTNLIGRKLKELFAK